MSKLACPNTIQRILSTYIDYLDKSKTNFGKYYSELLGRFNTDLNQKRPILKFRQDKNVLETVIRRNADNTERIMKNALGYMVCDNTYWTIGISSYDNTVSVGIIKLICKMLVSAARSAVRDIDSTNDLKFLRIATRKFEYLVAPENEFTIVVVQ